MRTPDAAWRTSPVRTKAVEASDDPLAKPGSGNEGDPNRKTIGKRFRIKYAEAPVAETISRSLIPHSRSKVCDESR